MSMQQFTIFISYKLNWDLKYIEKVSFVNDIKIIFKQLKKHLLNVRELLKKI